MHVGIAIPRWWGKRSRHSRRMHNPQFYVSDKRPMPWRPQTHHEKLCEHSSISITIAEQSLDVTVGYNSQYIVIEAVTRIAFVTERSCLLWKAAFCWCHILGFPVLQYVYLAYVSPVILKSSLFGLGFPSYIVLAKIWWCSRHNIQELSRNHFLFRAVAQRFSSKTIPWVKYRWSKGPGSHSIDLVQS